MKRRNHQRMGRVINTAVFCMTSLALPRAQSQATPAVDLAKQKHSQADWPAYNGGIAGDHYSPLQQINVQNVHQLKEVWRAEVGVRGGLQTNPLAVGRVVYVYSPTLQVIALDGTTGKQLWIFDSKVGGGQPCRGFSYWTNGKEGRLFAYVANFLYALDPSNGKPIASFGENGRLDLRKDLGTDFTQNLIALTTPGVIYKNLIITGFRAPEQNPAPHGDIRAYNVISGKLAWSFHTIPHPGEAGYDTWPKEAWKTAGAANNWAGMAVDTKRGIIFAPTGSAVSDFYGYDRLGDDLFANTLLALDANTGKLLWHFQDVHHDIWDRDFPSPPALVTVLRDGRKIDAVAQTTKHGFVFLFERVHGTPLFPIEERPFPASDVPGEVASKTQPIPLAPAPYARQSLTAEMLTTRTPAAHAWALKVFNTFRSDGLFVPLGLHQQTVVFPGFDGGAEWGGPAVDPHSGVIFINANDLPWTGGLEELKHTSPGQLLYQVQCAVCHGANRQGNPPAFPSLIDVDKRLKPEQITDTIHNGKGRMPGFPTIQDQRLEELLGYLNNASDTAPTVAAEHGGADAAGRTVYKKNCAICHGDDRLGAPNYPGLSGVRSRRTDADILTIIHDGRIRMPGFPGLTPAETGALLRYLGQPVEGVSSTRDTKELSSNAPPSTSPRYTFTGYKKFLDPDGYPAVVPPWGTLNAIDLNTGRFIWKVPLGQYPELAATGLSDTGSENYGGPVLTASGLLFIGATIYDHKFRAFDAATGKQLWEADLPFAGNATPATYMIDGKQYIVIACSNARNEKAAQGAAYVAFALE